MARLFSRIAPIHLLWAARCVMLPMSALFAIAYVLQHVSGAAAWGWVFVETLVILGAFPRIRSSDLFSMLAIIITCADFLSASMFHFVDWERWLLGLAGIGGVVLPLKIYRLRARMTDNPYRAFAAAERRGSLYVRDIVVEAAPVHEATPKSPPALPSSTKDLR